jgi:hypothetical protein
MAGASNLTQFDIRFKSKGLLMGFVDDHMQEKMLRSTPDSGGEMLLASRGHVIGKVEPILEDGRWTVICLRLRMTLIGRVQWLHIRFLLPVVRDFSAPISATP